MTVFQTLFQQPGPATKVFLAGFGKLPAEPEHISKLGEFSSDLIEVRDALYSEGIQRLWPEWDALQLESRCAFDHWLIQLKPECTVIGRIVESSDSARRGIATFTVLAGFPAGALPQVLGLTSTHLDDFARRCTTLPTLAVVQAAFANQQGVLGSLLESGASASDTLFVSPEQRAAFFDNAGMDSEGVAMSRLLYKVKSSWLPFAPLRSGKAPATQELGVAYRLPVAPNQVTAAVLLWEEFVAALVHRDVPRTYIIPAHDNWLDIVIGKVQGRHFAGLQKNRTACVLETEGTYESAPDFPPELKELARSAMAAWRRGDSLSAVLLPKAEHRGIAPETKSKAAIQPAHLGDPQSLKASPSNARLYQTLALVLGTAMVALSGWWFFQELPARREVAQKFAQAWQAGQAAEQAGNWTNALASYQEASRWKKDDPQGLAKIREVTPKAQSQVAQAEEAAKRSREAAQKFAQAWQAGQAAEQAGNWTNALASYQEASRWKKDDPQGLAKIREVTPKANTQSREQSSSALAAKATDPNSGDAVQIADLDRQLKSLLDTFSLDSKSKGVRATQIPPVGKAPKNIDEDEYLDIISKLQNSYKANGSLDNDRKSDLKRLSDKIRRWSLGLD